MSDIPVQVIVGGFQDVDGASTALKALKEAHREGLVKIDDAAVVRKDTKGKIHIKETADMGGGKGAVLGGVAGGAIGVIAGAALAAPAAVGALIGGLAAKISDSGFANERLRTLGEALPNGSSAIVAVVEHTWVDAVRKELEEDAADVFTEELSAALAAQLEDGMDVAATALAADQGVAVAAEASDAQTAEGGAVVIDDHSVAGISYAVSSDGVSATPSDEEE